MNVSKANRTFVLGDPHGGLRAIQQCFERSGIDKYNDTLICIGDVADGWPDVAESLEELLTVKNLHYVLGNHDSWLKEYLTMGYTPNIWLSQGGLASLNSYENNPHLKEKHRDFYNSQPYFRVIDSNLYVHGGFNTMIPVKDNDYYEMMWNRDMWFNAKATAEMQNTEKSKRRISYQLKHINDYKEVFIGHTTTSRITIDNPVNYLNIWNVDQGAGWEGKLTIMNVDTKDFWQSDVVKDLYPEVKGRR